MRTTIDLDDALMRAVKRLASETGTTMTAIVEEALRNRLAPARAPKRRASWRWVTVKGRLRPGVDLTDRDRLYDLMEGRE